MSFLVKRLWNLRVRNIYTRGVHSAPSPLLLSPKEAHNLAKAGGVSFLDASWFMPNAPRNARNEFASKRLPSAQLLDLDEVASPNDLGLKHMMPAERVFADACETFGIQPSSHVVIYDTYGVFSSPRALFMFRAFGHQRSSIIDGGLPRWEADGLPLETSGSLPATARRSKYPTPTLNQAAVKSYDQIVSNACLNPSTDLNAELVLDARARGRYTGADPEPRAGLSSGHIPHSYSLPFNMFLQKRTSPGGVEYTTFLPNSELKTALIGAVGEGPAQKILDGKASVITTCGSGMTAGVLWLGLKLLGVDSIGLYDESWTGYAMRKESKIDKTV